jgi:hypothetical protein
MEMALQGVNLAAPEFAWYLRPDGLVVKCYKTPSLTRSRYLLWFLGARLKAQRDNQIWQHDGQTIRAGVGLSEYYRRA